MYAIEEASTNNNSEVNENTSNERVVLTLTSNL